MMKTIISIIVALEAPKLSAAEREGVNGQPITIPLEKENVPVLRNNRIVSHKTSYYGRIYLGHPSPQEFKVVFDTGSAHVLLPSSSCSSETCRKHRHYERGASGSAISDEDDQDEVQLAFATGYVTGNTIRDTVCVLEHSQNFSASAAYMDCAQVRLVLAKEMSSDPFDNFSFDGVLGLGLEALAVNPEFSYFGQMMRANKLEEYRFAYFLSHGDVGSEITLGGYDERRLKSKLGWLPLERPEHGYWQVRVRSVTIAGEALPLCEEEECTAIADTGTASLGVPKSVMNHLHLQFARQVTEGGTPEMDCRQYAGPDLIFDFGDVKVTVGPEEYSRPVPTQVSNSKLFCRAQLMAVDYPHLGANIWILGEPVLRKYYTVYDWGNKKIGFGLADHSFAGGSNSSLRTPTPANQSREEVEKREAIITIMV